MCVFQYFYFFFIFYFTCTTNLSLLGELLSIEGVKEIPQTKSTKKKNEQEKHKRQVNKITQQRNFLLCTHALASRWWGYRKRKLSVRCGILAFFMMFMIISCCFWWFGWSVWISFWFWWHENEYNNFLGP